MSALSPKKLVVRESKKSLEVTFSEQQVFEFSAEMLRVFSPSAEVQGHSPSQRITVAGKRDVGIMKIEPIGNYAVRITFDDMHSTGIFSWVWFLEFGTNMQPKWQEYLDDLSQKGLSRDAGGN